MPKRYRVVRGSNEFTWEYIDEDAVPWTLLAESHERWASRAAVRREIREMSDPSRPIKDRRDGNGKPDPMHPRRDTGYRHPDD
jgi:hypothetical protein